MCRRENNEIGRRGGDEEAQGWEGARARGEGGGEGGGSGGRSNKRASLFGSGKVAGIDTLPPLSLLLLERRSL